MSWFNEDRGPRGQPGTTGPAGLPYVVKFAQLNTGSGEHPMLAAGEVIYYMQADPHNTLTTYVDPQYGFPAHINLDGPGVYQISTMFQYRGSDNPCNFTLVGLTADVNSWYDLAYYSGGQSFPPYGLARLNCTTTYVCDGTVTSVHLKRDNDATGMLSTFGYCATFTVLKLLSL